MLRIASYELSPGAKKFPFFNAKISAANEAPGWPGYAFAASGSRDSTVRHTDGGIRQLTSLGQAHWAQLARFPEKCSRAGTIWARNAIQGDVWTAQIETTLYRQMEKAGPRARAEVSLNPSKIISPVT
jgi:hypothetical protein